MSRGNRKEPIFEDDLDRLVFDEALASMTTRYGVRIYASCQMGNHYHAVLDAPRHNLSDAMQHLNSAMARASNRRYARCGHLFEARFRSIVIDGKPYLKKAIRYVVLNPVKAGIAQSPASWRWSTYRATAGIDSAPHWLYLDWLLWAFRSDSLTEAHRRYRRYVNSPHSEYTAMDDGDLVLGSPSFKARVQEFARHQVAAGSLPELDAALNRPSLSELFAAVGSNGVNRNELIRVAHVTHGYHLSEISRFLGLHPSAASAILRRMTARAPSNGQTRVT